MAASETHRRELLNPAWTSAASYGRARGAVQGCARPEMTPATARPAIDELVREMAEHCDAGVVALAD